MWTRQELLVCLREEIQLQEFKIMQSFQTAPPKAEFVKLIYTIITTTTTT